MKYEISLMDNSFYEYLTSTLRYNEVIERINKICLITNCGVDHIIHVLENICNVFIDSVKKIIHRLSDLFDDLLYYCDNDDKPILPKNNIINNDFNNYCNTISYYIGSTYNANLNSRRTRRMRKYMCNKRKIF